MGSNLIDDVSPDRTETHPLPSARASFPAGYLAPASSAPASAAPSGQQANGRARSSVLPAPPEEAPLPDGKRSERRRGPWRYLLIPLVLLLALAAGIGGGFIGARLAPAPETSTQTVSLSASVDDLQQAVENVSQGAQPSVIEVESRGGLSGTAIASGVILTRDGYIVTNDHAVNGYSAYTVTLSDGTSLTARLVGEDARADLAVLKVAASDLTPITFADSGAVKAGQFVVALGSPIGFENSATFGVVSALDRTVSEQSSNRAIELTGMIQTNVTLNPGNSGGALLDLNGRLIGIPTLGIAATSSGADVDGMGFAIPSNQVKSVTDQLIQHGQVDG